MNNESRVTYSDHQRNTGFLTPSNEGLRESLLSHECSTSKPRILAFMGASGSGKDLAIEILTSLPGRRSVSKKLELFEPVTMRVIPKITDRPPRVSEVSKYPVTPEEFTELQNNGLLIGEYTLQSNGCRYAYRLQDITQTCREQFLVAEPSVLHILELKEKFGDQIHCTFLTSSRGYRERLLQKRGTESPEEIRKRLDEGDGQTVVALLLAGKSAEFISNFVSPDIAAAFQQLINSPPENWKNQDELNRLRNTIGPELVNILESVIAHKGNVVDELINIDRFHTFIDDIVILDDKFVTENPYEAGLFSESIIDTATRMLLNSENRVLSVDQTANADIICNLVVPEAAKSEEAIFGISYEKIIEAITKNQEDRVVKIYDGVNETPFDVRWTSFYEDRERVFGLIIRDPKNPESVVSFRAIKPDGSQEALIEFQIHLASIERATDRTQTQMAFMSKSIKLCEALGIEKFHYAEHFDLVDEADTVIGLVSRTVAHEENKYIHRAVSVMMWRWRLDESKQANVRQLLMVRRSKNKKMNPNVWQAAASGHLFPGETYTEAARRQLREEIGVDFTRRITTLQPVMPIRVYSEVRDNATPQKENFYFFMAHADADTANKIDTNYEVANAQWMDIDTIRTMIHENPDQFRDAFRLAFQAVDWEHFSDVKPQGR